MIDFSSLSEHKIPCKDEDGYIYFLLYREGLVYIGQTVSIDSRIKGHSDKVFDKVLYERCPVENLNKREVELIKHYQPILNGSSNNNPKVKVRIFDDYAFIHHRKKCCKIIDGKLHNSYLGEIKDVVGELNGNIVEWVDYPYFFVYNTETNELTKKDAYGFYGNHLPKGTYAWDKAKGNEKVFNEEISNGVSTYKKLEVGFIFEFGKYKGIPVSSVLKTNPSYIDWFERVVLNGEAQK